MLVKSHLDEPKTNAKTSRLIHESHEYRWYARYYRFAIVVVLIRIEFAEVDLKTLLNILGVYKLYK